MESFGKVTFQYLCFKHNKVNQWGQVELIIDY